MRRGVFFMSALFIVTVVSAAHALSIDNTVNPNVTAAYQAGATFVGLVPKLPLEVLNRQLGTPTAVAMSESLMGCKFPVSVYLDDEDSGNTNDLAINGMPYRRQNALLGGFGHPPGAGNGPAGINTLISYCQVPVRQLPRTQLDYMVFSAQEKTELKTIRFPLLGTVSWPVRSPICPAGSYGVRLELDTERESANYLVGGEKALFAPNEVLGTNLSFSRTACNGKPIYYYYNYDNNYPVCDGETPAGSSLSNSGSVLFNMCFVPADPHAATELPTTFEVFDGDGFVIQNAENYIYFARDVS